MRRATSSLLRSVLGLVGLGFLLGGGLMVVLLFTARGQCHAAVGNNISTHTQCHEINGIIWLGVVALVGGLVAIIASRFVVGQGDHREFHATFEPGWYTDLEHPELERRWDGTQWTSEMREK